MQPRNDDQPPGKRRSWLRILGYGVLGLVLLVGLGIAGVLLLVDLNAQRPRIEAALQDATGRRIALEGPIRIAPSLVPTLAAERVAVAASPGFSRPNLATAERIEVSLALLPLLGGRVEVARVQLHGADVLLERRADGAANWQVPAATQAAPPPAPPEAPAGEPTRLHLALVELTDSRLVLDDARSRRRIALGVQRFELRSPEPGDPMQVSFDGSLGDRPLTLAATTGPLDRLLDPAARSPWPLEAELGYDAARLRAKGSLTEPLAGRGYALEVSASLPDTQMLASLVPGLAVPPAQRLAVQARLRDTGAALPALEAIEAMAAVIDLGAYRPGLRLSDLRIEGADAAAPLALQARLGTPEAGLALTGTLPPAARLAAMGGGDLRGALPFRLALEGEGVRATAEGQVRPAAPRNRIGAAIELSIADLARLESILGPGLPKLTQVAFATRVSETDGTIQFRDLRLGHADSRIQGQADLRLQGGVKLDARLTGPKFDLGPFLPQGDPAAPPAAAPQPAQASPDKVLPQDPLPLALLNAADADIDLRLGQVLADEFQARDVHIALKLASGRLQLAPLEATLPAGKATLRLDLDASKPAPPTHLMVQAPALQAAPLMRAAGLPRLQGALGIDVDLRGQGRSIAELLGTSNGHVAIGMDEGRVDLALLGRIGGDILRAANLTFRQDGQTVVHCLAVRFEHQRGVATARTFDFVTDVLDVTGSGSIDLGRETLNLVVTPTAKTAALGIGPGIAVPLRVSGTLAQPRAAPDPAGVAREALGTALNLGIPALGIARGLASRADTGCGSTEPARPSAPQSPAAPANPAEQLRRILPGLPGLPGSR